MKKDISIAWTNAIDEIKIWLKQRKIDVIFKVLDSLLIKKFGVNPARKFERQVN